MSVNIVLKGFSQDLSSTDAVNKLTVLFKGDKLKAEEVYHSKEYVLQTVDSEAEARLLLPRLQKMGLVCEVVDTMPTGFEEYKNQGYVAGLVTCPACGYEQISALACSECGQSFVVKKRIDWKPPVQHLEPVAENQSVNTDDDKPSGLMGWRENIPLPTFGLPSLRTVVILLTIGGTLIGLGGGMLFGGGGEGSKDTAIMMLIKGILSYDKNDSSRPKAQPYDPEAGKNPYAERLKSLGVDQKKFSEATGVKGGTIKGSEVKEFIEKNETIKGAIHRAEDTAEARSAGNTETDQKIEDL